ncbi:MAG: response regulator, partial [Candidatus Tectomicrobia bacterium]
TDYEPHSLHPREAPPGTAPIHHEDRRHVRFLDSADLVIHDAQYTLDDFPAKAGWGHTPMERAVDYAMLAQAKRLALFHHDPDRADEAVDRLSEQANARVAAGGAMLEVFAAAEGQVIELGQKSPCPRLAIAPEASAMLSLASLELSTVLIVDDDPVMVLLVQSTLQDEGVRVLTAPDGETALRLARQEHPAMMLLDFILPGLDGLGVCRMLRAEADPRLCDMPIVMLTGEKLQETDLVEAFAAGVTDYLTKPIKPTFLRARIRSWLLRTSTGSTTA